MCKVHKKFTDSLGVNYELTTLHNEEINKKIENNTNIYTGCPRRKRPNFGRVFLRSNYNDITQNDYIQSSMVTEILAREF